MAEAKKKVRLKLNTSMVGPKVSHKPGAEILVDEDEAARHVEAGNGEIVTGPAEQTEIDRLKVENAQLKATIANATPQAELAAEPKKK